MAEPCDFQIPHPYPDWLRFGAIRDFPRVWFPGVMTQVLIWFGASGNSPRVGLPRIVTHAYRNLRLRPGVAC